MSDLSEHRGVDRPRTTRIWVWAGAIWLAIIIWMIAANARTAEFVYLTWQIDAYGHSWLVVLIFAWLVWRLREPLFSVPPVPSFVGAGVLAAIAVVWWLGYALEFRFVQQLAITAAITGVTWALLGGRVVWLLAFPLLYLFLTVSAWDVLVRPMQEATAWLAEPTVRALGVPLFRDGPYLWIPEGRFLVDETCAGLRYLLAGLAIGSLYAYLIFDDLGRRGLFILLTMIYALLLNVVRVAIVVYAGHVTDMQHVWVRAHDDLGWILFFIGLFLLFFAGSLMQRMPAFFRVRGPSAIPRGRSPTVSSPRRATWGVMVSLLVILVAFPSFGSQWFDARTVVRTADAVPPDLPAVAGWVKNSPESNAAEWRPRFPTADAHLRGTYGAEGKEVQVSVAWYAYQRGSAKLHYFENAFFDRRRWQVIQDHRRDGLSGAASTTVREKVLRPQPMDDGVRVLWFWYVVGGHDTLGALEAQVAALYRNLLGETQAMVVAIAADGATETQARDSLRDFWFASSGLRDLSGSIDKRSPAPE